MFDYQILPDHKLVVLRFWGTTTAEEILGMSAALRGDPGFSESYDTVVDNSRLEGAMPGQEMRELEEPRTHFLDSPTRVAIVAPTDLTYGMSRMYQLVTEFRSPSEVGVFRDMASALAWLGREGLDLGGADLGGSDPRGSTKNAAQAPDPDAPDT